MSDVICHEAAIAQRKEVVAAPNFAKEDVVVEVSELRGKVAELLATCRLNYFLLSHNRCKCYHAKNDSGNYAVHL